ncbi:hypothetical protein I549_3470 [Mycobacterium avium subsp. avium 2285 (R)]|nr:hypothetical protein I549_3470 [Mycobacterium avium subsp. avium 2285 (R)]
MGISATTLAAGYLTDPMVEDLPHPWLDAVGIPDRVGDAIMAFLALLIVTSVSMVFGELVPKYLAVARPMSTARAVVAAQLLFSALLTPAIRLTNGAANWIVRRLGVEPAEELRSARSPRSCCRWCARRRAAARWTPRPRPWCGARCSSGRSAPRS